MSFRNTLNNTLKGILTVALLGALTTGCSKKANDQAADGNTQAERPAEGLQDADTMVIGSDGSITELDESGAVVEEIPADTAQQTGEGSPASEAGKGDDAVISETPASGGSGESAEQPADGSQTSGSSESGSGQEGAETPDPDPNAKDTGGF